MSTEMESVSNQFQAELLILKIKEKQIHTKFLDVEISNKVARLQNISHAIESKQK